MTNEISAHHHLRIEIPSGLVRVERPISSSPSCDRYRTVDALRLPFAKTRLEFLVELNIENGPRQGLEKMGKSEFPNFELSSKLIILVN